MAMTAAVKDELSRLVVTKPCCRRAEVAALLRFAGGLSGRSHTRRTLPGVDATATCPRIR